MIIKTAMDYNGAQQHLNNYYVKFNESLTKVIIETEHTHRLKEMRL
jgi:hypothetical protein